MQILLINGNTSAEITERLAAEARRFASPGTEITAVAAEFGVDLIRSRSDSAIAGHAVLAALAKHYEGNDAVVLAVSTETGLLALRECSPVPVVGMTEASLFMACLLGGRFGVLVFDRRALPVFRELVASHGLLDRMAGMEAVDMTTADFREPERVSVGARRAIGRLIDQSAAECVVVTGAATAGIARSLQEDSPVPLLDGLSCGVVLAEALVRLKRPKPKTGSYAAQTSGTLTGVDPVVAKFLGKSPD